MVETCWTASGQVHLFVHARLDMCVCRDVLCLSSALNRRNCDSVLPNFTETFLRVLSTISRLNLAIHLPHTCHTPGLRLWQGARQRPSVPEVLILSQTPADVSFFERFTLKVVAGWSVCEHPTMGVRPFGRSALGVKSTSVARAAEI